MVWLPAHGTLRRRAAAARVRGELRQRHDPARHRPGVTRRNEHPRPGIGQIFQDGRFIASVVQEGLIRVSPRASRPTWCHLSPPPSRSAHAKRALINNFGPYGRRRPGRTPLSTALPRCLLHGRGHSSNPVAPTIPALTRTLVYLLTLLRMRLVGERRFSGPESVYLLNQGGLSPGGTSLLGTHKPPSDSLDRVCPARGSADPAIPEFHPDPDAEDGSTTDALVRGPVDALTR